MGASKVTSQHAIIVGHGQPSDPDPAEAMLAAFAEDVARHLPGWQVTSATLAKPGALDQALTDAADTPLVYPMFMSEGWFTQVQLIKRIGEHPARVAKPFGVDPALPRLAADLLEGVLAQNTWQAQEATLFIPAHGSGRSPNAARDTYAFANALGELISFADLRVGFVEQDPRLIETATGLPERSISLPFFAAELGHVIDDVPEALEQTGFKGVALAPIGCASEVPAMVARALLNYAAESKSDPVKLD